MDNTKQLNLILLTAGYLYSLTNDYEGKGQDWHINYFTNLNFKNYKINYRYSKLKLDHKSFYHKIFDHFIKKYLKNLSNKKKLVLEVGAGKGYRAKYLYRKVNYTGLEPTKLPFLKYNLCKNSS